MLRSPRHVSLLLLDLSGVFDNKTDLPTIQSHFHGTSVGLGGAEAHIDMPPKLKLGLAPLSSELALFGPRHPSSPGLNSQPAAK